MSTRPIREALEAWSSERLFASEKEKYEAALEAVRAIEEMAKFFVKIDAMENPPIGMSFESAKAHELLESIAKEAP